MAYMNDIFLILESGEVFGGKSFGARSEVSGEVVFTTSMTGYIEMLTDPASRDIIVVSTFPQIGNYGYIGEDAESEKPHPKAYIVSDLCDAPSNFRCEGKLSDYLLEHGVVGIAGVDTRTLTKLIRKRGSVRGRISFEPQISTEELEKLKNYKPTKAADESPRTEAPAVWDGGALYKVVLCDYGAKDNISRCLCERGCEIIRLPYNFTAEQVIALKPDGIVLSGGSETLIQNSEIIEQLRKLSKRNIPTFGIALGHILFALALRGQAQRHTRGHRGSNQPVKDTKTEKLYITSQNHGYVVLLNSIPKEEGADIRYISANDNSCEGIDYPLRRAFTVQFNPEGAAGTHDTLFLFDRFVELMKEGKADAAR